MTKELSQKIYNRFNGNYKLFRTHIEETLAKGELIDDDITNFVIDLETMPRSQVYFLAKND